MTNSSARRFPANPPDEELRETYDAMRSALISVNISRGIFRSQSEKRGVVIAELQRELQELEADLGNEARAKARLHAMNSRLVEVIRELEATGDAIAEAVEESEEQSGFWLVRMFQRLVELARQWRAVKAKAAAIASETSQIGPEG
jgi:capsule polysaccharide export protein KpsE/RkpR